MSGRLKRVEVHLLDGRVFDVSGLTADEALALLDREGATLDDVASTRHYVDVPLAALRAPPGDSSP